MGIHRAHPCLRSRRSIAPIEKPHGQLSDVKRETPLRVGPTQPCAPLTSSSASAGRCNSKRRKCACGGRRACVCALGDAAPDDSWRCLRQVVKERERWAWLVRSNRHGDTRDVLTSPAQYARALPRYYRDQSQSLNFGLDTGHPLTKSTEPRRPGRPNITSIRSAHIGLFKGSGLSRTRPASRSISRRQTSCSRASRPFFLTCRPRRAFPSPCP